jgi:hypothetical protein
MSQISPADKKIRVSDQGQAEPVHLDDSDESTFVEEESDSEEGRASSSSESEASPRSGSESETSTLTSSSSSNESSDVFASDEEVPRVVATRHLDNDEFQASCHRCGHITSFKVQRIEYI